VLYVDNLLGTGTVFTEDRTPNRVEPHGPIFHAGNLVLKRFVVHLAINMRRLRAGVDREVGRRQMRGAPRLEPDNTRGKDSRSLFQVNQKRST
jgi:hypothetical protein